MQELFAFLAGAVIILFFSYNRFNRMSHAGNRQLERLLPLLSPDSLSARQSVLSAYFFYVFALLVIYVLLCAYAKLLSLGGGLDVSGGAVNPPTPATPTGQDAGGHALPAPGQDAPWDRFLSGDVSDKKTGPSLVLNIDSSISLGMALIITGLAPSFPVLRRVENWMRVAVHRLAGIPTRALVAGEILRFRAILAPHTCKSTLRDDNPQTDQITHNLLISDDDWRRIDHYSKSDVKQYFPSGDDTLRDIELIFAVSAWFLNKKLFLAQHAGREKFHELEEDLDRRKRRLQATLDRMTGYSSDGNTETTQSHDTGADHSAGVYDRANWEHLGGEARELADDIRLLLALYVEHGIITRHAERSYPSAGEGEPSSRDQERMVMENLDHYLAILFRDGPGSVFFRSNALSAVVWAVLPIFLISILWSIWPGNYETALQRPEQESAYARAWSYVFLAFNSYCIPLLVALAIRDGGLQTHRWRNMRSGVWTEKLPQAMVILLASWAVATLFMMSTALWLSAFNVGNWKDVTRDLMSTLLFLFEYNAPTIFRGAVLSLIVVYVLDTGSARFQKPLQSADPPALGESLYYAVTSAAIMFLLGAMTRWLTSWASAANANPPRTALDDVDYGLILYAALYSALIGFFVVFFIHAAVCAKRKQPAQPPPAS